MVTLYSNNCPRCHALEKMMTDRSIDFDLNTDEQEIIKIGEKENILSAPILKVEGEYMDFSKAVKWVKEIANEH